MVFIVGASVDFYSHVDFRNNIKIIPSCHKTFDGLTPSVC